MKTYHPKAKEIKRGWHEVDASALPLGRLATDIATKLMGKDKPTYSPHMDNGDFVVVLNAKDVKVTGKKQENKVYYKHSGYPGGFKEVSFMKLKKEHPEKIIEMAVYGMLPGNRLRAKRMTRLKIVKDDKNPYGDKK